MPEITVNVKSSNDQKYSVTIDTSKTVLEFKQVIAEKSDTAAERQRLIYSGKVLKDNDTLETYKIADGHTVHMVKGASQPSTTSQEGTRSTTTPATTTPPATQTTVPTPEALNPFGALGGMGGLGDMGGMGGLGFGFNPQGGGGGGGNFMELLNNPAIMQYLSQVMQDPQFVEQMIAMQPQLASMRQMMQDPEFQSLMSNPEILRSMASLSSMMGPGGIGGLGGQPTRPPVATTQPSTNRSATTETTSTTPNSTVPNTTPNTTTTPINNPLLSFLTGAGNLNSTQPPFDPSLFLGAQQQQQQQQQPPEERYQVQLQQLNEMGFWDAQKNIRALLACGGNVNAAIELLLSGNL